MYFDTLILLVLKEIFKDPYLVNHIYNIVLNDEIYLMSILHKKKSRNLREDINLLYPGFIKTAIFENIRFNEHDDIEPGYSFYTIKPLINCGNYYNNYGEILPICKYRDVKENYNGVKILNDIRLKYSITEYGRDKLRTLIKKRNRYALYEYIDRPGNSVWYDFNNKYFTNI
tara:strand:- start:1854 stop:2369 length:516 start_codon:yes stop_codon:yes gene_type:complete